MNMGSSDTTNIATSEVSWWANATNTLINGGTFLSVSVGDVNLQRSLIIQRGMSVLPIDCGRCYISGLGLDLLNQNIASGAIYDSAERYDPPKCLPRTREAILCKIMDWVERRPENKELFLWLYGPAGAGKSAIAQTIAEMCEERGLLAASFFFCRTSSGRNDMYRLVSTILYQLIRTIPEIRDHVLTLLGKDPQILSSAPASQMRSLIVDPLSKLSPTILTKRPGLIIMDGLDECGNPDSQREILKFLASATSRLMIPLLFLIASRPEPTIRLTFNTDILKSITHFISLPDSAQSDRDLRLFLRTEFQEIRVMHPMRLHIPPSWPSDGEIEALVVKASGQFIYVSTVIRYIRSSCHRPDDRLATILALQSNDQPFSGLDSLYLEILSGIKKEYLDKVLDILRCLVFLWGAEMGYVSAAPERLEDFLGYRPGDLEIYMADLHALIYLPPPEKPHDPIRIHHASFPDFLVDPARSREFFLDAPTAHANIAYRWIPYMDKYGQIEDWGAKTKACAVHEEFYQIAREACSPELVELLTHFNFFDILKGNDCYDFSIWHIPAFLTWLCENRRSGALSAKAFNIQFQHFDQYVHHGLAALPPLHQKCIPAAVSLTEFYGCRDNAIRMIMIIGSISRLSHLFFNYPEAQKLDPSFRNTLQFLHHFFIDPSRSRSYCVTRLSYKCLALRCAEVIFDPTWAPDNGRGGSWEDSIVDGLRKTAIECLSLALPKASKSLQLARFLGKHALQIHLEENFHQERRELASLSLKYLRYWGVLPQNPKHDDNHFCVVCEESTHFHSPFEGVQAGVKHLLGFM
ncbi:hypothetical protein M413DRAFT_31173 [Hebeloma cylindrosporum]|uniref:NACHT domain-containing protein n=1 Tax=Hebeloma cylindrosporum TaxID=76867 RepID=A0A0C3BY81_HEBCY|nr:hypothetical protein M413DRAFT_31173 [Hebeloma cylindrosporum h7]